MRRYVQHPGGHDETGPTMLADHANHAEHYGRRFRPCSSTFAVGAHARQASMKVCDRDLRLLEEERFERIGYLRRNGPQPG